MLEVGIKAPDFILLDKDEKEISSKDIFEKYETVVLYFYPKDSTVVVQSKLVDLEIPMMNIKILMYQL